MKVHALAAITTSLILFASSCQANDDVWVQALRAARYVDTARAAFRPGCNQSNPLSQLPQYITLCPKLEVIPNDVIEAAALPFFRSLVSEADAREAIAIWSSAERRALIPKMIREISSGVYNQLTPQDMKLLEETNRLPASIRLSRFSASKDVGRAVAQAMLAYEPSQETPPK